jgi:septal ring factor EnvC (AmiA/AmiB activator)
MNIPNLVKSPTQSRTRRDQNKASLPSGRFAGLTPARLLLCLLLSFALPALAKKPQPAPPSNAEVADKKTNLKELRGQIDALRKEMAEAEGKRANVADQLKDVEQVISVTQRDLHNLSSQRSKLQGALKDLGAQAKELEARLGSQQGQLEKLVYRQYLLGNPDSLRLLLNGDNPSQMARDLHYLAAIGKARSQLLREIESTLQRKQTLTAVTKEKAEDLAIIEAKQKEQHGKLVAQREQRKAVLDKVSAKISEQRREIGNLQRDEKRLSQLIERLAKILAAKPVPHRETRTSAEKPVSGKSTPAEISNDNTPEAMPAGNFAQLKGNLRLPARGVVSNRFGSARQEGSNWKGLFIRATPGAEVKVIANGRVVFADWMRGFGNLMIVDHGSSYLTIYGNNEALLKQVGDTVHGGDTIASVGNSGGNPESGLYFELRHQGQPLDPLKWVNLK